jgi:hypothetical protein
MKTLVGALTVGAIFIVISAFTQTATLSSSGSRGPTTQSGYAGSGSAWGWRWTENTTIRSGPAAGSTCTTRAWPTMATMDNGLAKAEFVGWAS